MCSTCNYRNFEIIEAEANGRNHSYLEQELGYGGLVLRCTPNGKNYYLAIKDKFKSEFKCYRCPTCGRMLD